MYLYIVRHGQSVNNAGGNMDDPVLTELGHEQARRAGAFLAREEVCDQFALPVPTVVIASPMRRAMQTARHVADGVGVENVYVRHDTHECTGPEDGRLLRATIKDEFPKTIIDDDMPEGAWWPAVTEDHQHHVIEARARRVLSWLRKTYGGTDAVVTLVNHGAFGAYVTGMLLGNPFPRLGQHTLHNCAVSLFDMDERIDIGQVTRCYLYNDITHLLPDKIT